MDLELQGKAVLITGASRGIGRATALGLAAEGADLVLSARGQDGLDQVAAEARELGAKVVTVAGDAGNNDDRIRIAETAQSEFPDLYGFVSNSTSTEALFSTLDGASEASRWDGHINVDLLGAVRFTDLLSPGMVERRSGSIVYISSVAGKRAIGHGHAYVATKSALMAAAKSFALDLGRFDVRVNVIAPGTTLHPGAFIEAAGEKGSDMVEHHLATVPSGRFSRPDEVADCIVFMLSPKANRVVGHSLVVDGGEYHGVH